jgi:exodeoxyribonuclease V beta subunit
VPELISPLNDLFVRGNWFPDRANTCADVDPAPPDEGTRIEQDETGRSALTAVDISDLSKVGHQRRAFAAFAAREIRRLLADGRGKLRFSLRRDEPRALRPNDICILVDRNSDADWIAKALRKEGVPYLVYKKNGLWQSVEAQHVLFVLRALARPGDEPAHRKALLTSFFSSIGSDGVPRPILPQDLARDGAIGPDHPARRQLRKWRDLALARDWPALFHGLAGGGLLLDAIRDEHGGERRVANYRQIFDQLERQAVTEALDITSLADRVAGYRKELIDVEENDDLHVLETEKSKVVILTAHKSKGLEYPVVFIAAGFKEENPPDVYEFHDAGHRTFDLLKKPENHLRHLAERDAESARLFYVALTRAMAKLYAPYSSAEKPKGAGIKRITRAWNESKLKGGKIIKIDRHGHEIGATEDDMPNVVSETAGGETAPMFVAEKIVLPPIGEILPPIVRVDQRRSTRLFSFTGLTRREAAALHHAARERGLVTLDDRPAEPPGQDEQTAQPAIPPPDETSALAGGVEAGILLHGVLQRVDFAAVAAASRPQELLGGETGKLIETQVERYRDRLPAWRASQSGDPASAQQAVATMVFATLRVPLAGVGRLCDLPATDVLREMEFFLHVGSMSRSLPKLEAIEATADGFLTGSVDLLARCGKACYLIDYKTNWLPEGYGQVAMEEEMKLHLYKLQRAIYAAAVSKWLKARGGLTLAQADYLFVRGIGDGPNGPQAGIVSHSYVDSAQIVREFDELVSGRLAEQLVGR